MDPIPIPISDVSLLIMTTRSSVISNHDLLRNELSGDNSLVLFNNNVTTAPNSTAAGLYMGPIEAAITTVVWILILLTASIGNVLVILAILTHPALYIVQNFLLVSLACADILVALLVMPFAIVTTLVGEWLFGRGFCLFHVTCDVLLCTSSILHLVAIALDRFFAIHCPIRYAQTRNLTLVLTMIGAAWIVSGLISIPPLIGWNDMSVNPAECGYVSEKGYIIYSSLGSFYIPLIILVTVYLTIFISARRRLRRRAGGASPYSVTSVAATPQVDMTSIDSPDKSDVGSTCTINHYNSTGTASSSSGWNNATNTNNNARLLTAAALEHRRLHRKFLIFPIQRKCSACHRNQSRAMKEMSLITSSFHIIQDDDFSTAASPIVDLTVPHRADEAFCDASTGSINNIDDSIGGGGALGLLHETHGLIRSASNVKASVPLPDMMLPHNKTGSNGSLKSSFTDKSPSHKLFVPKIVRPKQLNPSGSNNKMQGFISKSKSTSSISSPKTEVKKHLLPNTNQSVDVKQSLAKRQKISLTRERRAARTLLIVVLVFVICWLPFFVWYVVKPFCPDCPMDERSYNFMLWLGFLNSSLNPVIYTIFNLDFRKAFKRIFHRMCNKATTFS